MSSLEAISISTWTGQASIQVEITVEDPIMFTSSWSALVTYRHVLGE
jgi:hypothetical protein